MKLTCIVCPNGCTMTVTGEGADMKVTGHKCPRGERFAIAEKTNPTRTICTTVKTVFPDVPVLPVRVSAEIPKNRIFDVMDMINQAVVTEPVGCGDVIIPNILGLGVDIIATSNIIKHSISDCPVKGHV